MIALALCLGLFAVAAAYAIWADVTTYRSARQLFSSRCDESQRGSSRPASSPQGGHDGPEQAEPDDLPSSAGTALSSPSLLAVSVLPLAAISPDPDIDAFLGGVQTALYVALATVAVFMGIGFIRKKLGE